MSGNMRIFSKGTFTLKTVDNQVFINGEQIKTPKRMNTNNQTIVNGKIYIGGYEYIKEKKEFKRTLTAIWHLLF